MKKMKHILNVNHVFLHIILVNTFWNQKSIFVISQRNIFTVIYSAYTFNFITKKQAIMLKTA